MNAPTSTQTINLIDALPSLADGLGEESRELARRHAVVRVIDLDQGEWRPAATEHEPGHIGLLVVEGFMTRDVHLGATVACELVGRGDILRPADHDGDQAPVPFAVGWRILTPTRIAILDRRATLVLGHWPELIEPLIRSSVRRAQSLGLHLAVRQLRRVEPRLQVMLWHIADRWGKVTPEGVHIPIHLTHRTLGNLVGAQRPSVTTAVRGLTSAGRIGRRADRTWILYGDPPDLLEELRGQSHEASTVA